MDAEPVDMASSSQKDANSTEAVAATFWFEEVFLRK